MESTVKDFVLAFLAIVVAMLPLKEGLCRSRC